jgi:membrane protein YqaA with SNARE-associated domain
VSFFQRLSQHLLVLGIPGLFFVALLDSAAIPMPGGPDAFVILLSWQRPAYFLWIALVAALGSFSGCLILYKIGHAGGALAMARISPRRQEWIKRKIEDNSFLAVFLAVLAPPPFPTKPVILAAGVLRIPVVSFMTAVLTGRLVRYVAVGYLAAHLGDQTARVIRSHYPAILLGLAGIALLFMLGRRLFRKTEKGPASHTSPPA